jgi:predicted Co/Zn/Cd cation transporter (cation efflux family)
MSVEIRALRLSAIGALLLAALGIGFAWLTASGAILLDGFFNLIAFAMGLLSLKVAGLLQQPDDERFHFGYAFFEPFLNTIKGLVTVAVAAFAGASAVDALLHGGRELVLGPAVGYAVVATAVCVMVALVQVRVAKQVHSPLVEVDARNWGLNAAVSGVVGVAFLGAFLLQNTRWSGFVPYVDPALVLALVVVAIPIPIRIVVQSVGQLVSAAPDPSVQQRVRAAFDGAVAPYQFPRTSLRMQRVGRYFYVLNHILVAGDFRVGRVRELDAIRNRVRDAIQSVERSLVIDTVFTEDEALVS